MHVSKRFSIAAKLLIVVHLRATWMHSNARKRRLMHSFCSCCCCWLKLTQQTLFLLPHYYRSFSSLFCDFQSIAYYRTLIQHDYIVVLISSCVHPEPGDLFQLYKYSGCIDYCWPPNEQLCVSTCGADEIPAWIVNASCQNRRTWSISLVILERGQTILNLLCWLCIYDFRQLICALCKAACLRRVKLC